MRVRAAFVHAHACVPVSPRPPPAPIGRYNIEKDVLPYDVARHVLARADVPSPRPSSQADVRVCVCSADDGNPYYFWRSEDAAIGPPNVKPCHICAGTGLAAATSAPGLGSQVNWTFVDGKQLNEFRPWDETFNSIPAVCWWCVTTMTSVRAHRTGEDCECTACPLL